MEFCFCRKPDGWETDGVFIGNYTDTWLGFGFFVATQHHSDSSPRFYSPGEYSGLSQRTDGVGKLSWSIHLLKKWFYLLTGNLFTVLKEVKAGERVGITMLVRV